MSKPILNLMIDIETLGTKPGCVVLSYCLKGFKLKPTDAGCPSLSSYINVASSIFAGFDTDKGTIGWWNSEDRVTAKTSIVLMQRDSEPVGASMYTLYNCLKDLQEQYDITLWGRGVGTFDLPILDEAMRRVISDYKTPWKFYQVRDLRTVYSLCQYAGMELEHEDTPHDAEADVDKQIREAQACFEFITKTKTITLPS